MKFVAIFQNSTSKKRDPMKLFGGIWRALMLTMLSSKERAIMQPEPYRLFYLDPVYWSMVRHWGQTFEIRSGETFVHLSGNARCSCAHPVASKIFGKVSYYMISDIIHQLSSAWSPKYLAKGVLLGHWSKNFWKICILM